jgi:hypothetical protein
MKNKTSSSERLGRLVRRHLRFLERGKQNFDRGNAVLQKAISAGLMPGAPVEVEIADPIGGTIHKEKFVLVDNVAALQAKGAVYRPARFPAFMIEKYRVPRKAKTEEIA